METLRGIFPQQVPPPKRDFLKENVQRIRKLQESRRNISTGPKKPCRALKPIHRHHCCDPQSPDTLSLQGRTPITNLRKSHSSASITISRDDATQTSDINDDMFLKDTIIRFPSASLIRRAPSNSSVSVQIQTTTKDTTEKNKIPYQSHFSDQKDEHCEKMDRHITDLSEFLEKAKISKRVSRPSSSILKNSNSSLVSRPKKSITMNESASSVNIQKENHHQENGNVIVISDEDDEPTREEESNKQMGGGDTATKNDKQEIDDPDCPDGHVPLTENERLEALQIAKKRFKVLVDELNRLPMTCETLRVRNRKIAIEKELRNLDKNILCFSRSKVYIKME